MSSLFRTVAAGGLLLSSAAAAAASGTGSGAGMTVHAGAAGEIHGTINATSPHVRQFLGIPFAEPPVGALRFQPPVKYASKGENATVNATAFAPSCMNPLMTPEAEASNIYNALMPEFVNARPDQSEDCLYLNVFAPLEPVAEKLPVIIWVYGGGFSVNSANVPYQAPDPWVESTQGHIVVTFNYRLDIFGYPNAAGQSVNAGLLDQRLAVEWVRDNIAAFGGDADRMVLWGQSAGAWSVHYYGYAYPEEPIVSGLVADSGGSSVFAPGDAAHANFSAVAAGAGCSGGGGGGGDDDAAAELACMQQVDTATVLAAAANATNVHFGPVADNRTVFADNNRRARDGRVARLPAIVGLNSREGTAFAPWDPETGLNETEVLAGGSQIIVCPTLSEIENRVAGGLTTYRYLYSGNFTNITPKPWIGAAHSSELPLIFGTHAQYRGNSTEFEWKVSEMMQGLWLSFASNPSADPAYGDFTWPKYDPAAETVASLAADDVVVQLGGSAVPGDNCA